MEIEQDVSSQRCIDPRPSQGEEKTSASAGLKSRIAEGAINNRRREEMELSDILDW